MTLCPGRFLARQEVLAFVATVLGRFEVGVVRTVGSGEGGLPRPETRNPPIGMMAPVKGQDVIVEVRETGRSADGRPYIQNAGLHGGVGLV